MNLEERLNADLREAMRNNDEVRKTAIRSAKAAIAEARVAGAQARTLGDQEVQQIIARQVKQRRDSILEFQRGNRPDLVAKEEAEIAVLEPYLPPQMDEAAIRERARAVIAEQGVSDLKGLGPVMRQLTAELRGRADGQVVNRIVRELLANPPADQNR